MRMCHLNSMDPEYGMEWWNGKWNGTVNAHMQLQQTCVTGAAQPRLNYPVSL